MAAVTLNKSVAGVWEGVSFAYGSGQTVDVDAGLAEDLVKAGHATAGKKGRAGGSEAAALEAAPEQAVSGAASPRKKARGSK